MVTMLNSIKKLLGIEPDDDSFDEELLMHINGVMLILNQLAVGPASGMTVTAESLWSDVFASRIDLQLVKSYIFLRVRLLFDPPQNSFLVQSINDQIKEFEWRLNVQAETPQVVV